MSTRQEAFQRWESYLYPGTSVLKNLAGITDDAAWDRREAQLVGSREQTVPRGSAHETSFAERLKEVHHHLFQDCYAWAGQFRDVPMDKEMPDRSGVKGTFVQHEKIEAALADVDQLYHVELPWHVMDQRQKANCLAIIYTHLNMIHPFREGNGRTNRIVVEEIANEKGLTIDWEKAKDRVLAATAASLDPRREQPGLDYEPAKQVFNEITSPLSTSHDLSLLADDLVPMSAPVVSLAGTHQEYDSGQEQVVNLHQSDSGEGLEL